jgi:hypothetical protein
MIIKAISDMSKFHVGFQVIEIKQVNFSLRWPCEEKGGLNFGVSLQKLLKTHVEKMSTFGPEQMLLKTSQLKFSSDYIYEKYGSC